MNGSDGSRSAAITLLAATVNGALGYGFSSITVPLALLFLSNRVLNPALVLIEVPLNAYVLWVNREALARRVAARDSDDRRPGARHHRRHAARVAGEPRLAEVLHVRRAAAADPAAGGRLAPADQSERSAGLVFGGGIGVLYSVTTISGPPLAIMLNNQGFAKKEFRAALGVVRLAESSMTAVAYVYGRFVH